MADTDILLPDETSATPDIPLDNLPSPKGVLSNKADDSGFTQFAKGAATTAIRGLAHIPTMLGDVATLPQTAVDIIRARVTGAPLEHVVRNRLKSEEQERVEQAKWFEKTYGRPMPHSHTPMMKLTGEKLSDPILEHTGTYEPTTALGRYGMAGGEGAFSMLGAGGVNALTRAAALPAGAGALRTARTVLGETGKAAGAGAASTTAGTAATDTLGPEAGIAAGFAVPAAAAKIASKASNYVRPMSPANHQQLADELALKNTKDPNAALERLQAEPADTRAPTAEVTGDPYHATADKMLDRHDPTYSSARVEQRGKQNEQRQQQLANVAPHDAKPSDVSAGFHQHLAELEAANEIHQSTIPVGAPPDITGGKLRTDVVVPQRNTIRGHLSKLYDSVDPDGVMSVVTRGPRETAVKLLASEQELNLPVSPLAKPLLEAFSQLDDVTSFQKLIRLDQRVTAAMKQAGKTSDPAHPLLVELKGAVKKSINDAIENQHEWEQQAIQRGELHPNDSLAARLERQRDEWLASRDAVAGESARTGTGPDVTEGSGSVPPAPGAASVSGSVGRAPGAEGVPSSEPFVPSMDPEAAARLALGNRGYGVYSRAYRQGVVGNALKTEGFQGQFKAADADVASSAFRPGPKGYEDTQAWLRASQNAPEAVGHIQDMAVHQLRGAMKDGPLDQKTLATWKAKHEGALRAIDEVTPGFSKSFDNAANATAAVRSFEQGAAKQFLHIEHGDDIVNHVGRLMNGDSGAAKITDLVRQAEALPQGGDAVVAGLRRAGADWMKNELSNTSLQQGAAGREFTLSPHQFLDFMRSRKGVLEALYTPEAVENMGRLAQDMERSRLVQSLQSVRGSDTTANATALVRHMGDLMKNAERHGASTAEAAIVSGLIFDMLQRGPSLTSLALLGAKQGASTVGTVLNRMHANGMLKTHNLFAEMMADPALMRAGLERAVDARGRPNTTAFERLGASLGENKTLAGAANAEQRGEDVEQRSEDVEQRTRHTAGGSVKIDHAAHAARLVRLVAEARKETSRDTEPMLKLPDATVTHALAIANERLQ